MKYVLKQYVDWGKFGDDFESQWTYLTTHDNDYRSTSWSPLFKNAMIFDNIAAAILVCDKSGGEIEPLTDKEIFKRKLEGE